MTKIINPFEFKKDKSCKVILATGGFDSIHIGHRNYLKAAKDLGGLLFVAVMDDNFLIDKKGYYLHNERDRLELVSDLSYVDYCCLWGQEDGLVDELILTIQPDYFVNGGDRGNPLIASPKEMAACEKVDTKTVFGIGGYNKTDSSTNIAQRIKEHFMKNLDVEVKTLRLALEEAVKRIERLEQLLGEEVMEYDDVCEDDFSDYFNKDYYQG